MSSTHIKEAELLKKSVEALIFEHTSKEDPELVRKISVLFCNTILSIPECRIIDVESQEDYEKYHIVPPYQRGKQPMPDHLKSNKWTDFRAWYSTLTNPERRYWGYIKDLI